MKNEEMKTGTLEEILPLLEAEQWFTDGENCFWTGAQLVRFAQKWTQDSDWAELRITPARLDETGLWNQLVSEPEMKLWYRRVPAEEVPAQFKGENR